MQNPDNISLNFILSTGRTGSTLLTSMFNMHPEMLSVSEEPFAYNLYLKYKSLTLWDEKTIEEFCYDFYLFSEGKLEPQFGTKEDLIAVLTSHKHQLNGINAIKLAYFAFCPQKDKTAVHTIVDKQLKYHYFLEKVARFYPESKFIVLYRDPRDNVLVKLRRAARQKKKADLVYFAKTWEYEYTTIIRKVKALPKERYIEVKYEDLMEFPERELQRICQFFGIAYTDAMLNYDEKAKKELENNTSYGETIKQHLSLLHEGLTQKVSTDKVGFWKTNLSEKEYNTVWSICGGIATEIGYEKGICKAIPYFKLSMIPSIIHFNIKKIIVPNFYYSLPFGIRYLIKKMRYGKNFRNGKWATKDFYTTTLPKKN
jgi:protein-tyrosine sulfotransferase